jgi:hypothetical protein
MNIVTTDDDDDDERKYYYLNVACTGCFETHPLVKVYWIIGCILWLIPNKNKPSIVGSSVQFNLDLYSWKSLSMASFNFTSYV